MQHEVVLAELREEHRAARHRAEILVFVNLLRLQESRLYTPVESFNIRLVRPRIDDAELVAVELVESKIRREDLLDTLCDLAQNLIAKGSVVDFVDDLEIVDAKNHQCAAPARLARLVKRRLHALLQAILVQKSRDGVRTDALPHEPKDSRIERPLSFMVERSGAAALDPLVFPLARPRAKLNAALSRMPLQHIVKDLRGAFALRRMHDFLPRLAKGGKSHRFRRYAEILHDVRRRHRHLVLQIHHIKIAGRRPLQHIKINLQTLQQGAQSSSRDSAHGDLLLSGVPDDLMSI